MSRTRVLQSVGVVAVLALIAGIWWVARDDDGGGSDAVADWPERGDSVIGQSDGVRILLSQGRAEGSEPLPVVAGDPLTPDQIAAIVARLQPLRVEPDDQQAFNRPAQTLNPPTAGTTIDSRFGEPQPPAPEVSTGPLEVVRVQPSGDVDIAPFVTVTFNQPMIPLATLDQLDDEDVPVTLDPEVPGRWRWLGTRTLRFEATPGQTDRLPMATEFTVSIPAGVTSETGGTLADDASFTFTTPAPQVIRFTPTGDSMTTTPVWVAVFDQLIDPRAVLDTIEVRAGNSNVGIRLATDNEIAADETASRIWTQAHPDDGEQTALAGRFVMFTPEQPLPTDTAISIAVGPGTPSAEGPQTTTSEQAYSARTYGPFELRRAECGYGDDECRPGYPFRLEFTNQIDSSRFDPSLIQIDPPVAASIGAYGNTVEINADSAGNTTYEVVVPAGMPDVFGQTLAKAATATFKVGDALPRLFFHGRDPLTVDPFAPSPSMSVQVVNHDELNVRAYAVTPGDWQSYQRLRESVYEEEGLRTPPGQQVLDTTIATDAPRGERTEVVIDLSAAFDAAGSNQLVVVVESTRDFDRNDDEFWDNRPVTAWVQQTAIGVDAFADNERLVVWTTDLRDGSPIAGADVTLGSTTVATDADGLAAFELTGSGHQFLTVAKDGDAAMLRADHSGSWRRYDQNDIARWYVFDDRGLYRPGETAHLKGWVRRFTLSQDATIERLPEGTTARYTAYDPFGNEIAAGTMTLDAAGGFDIEIPIPAGSNLGQAWVELQLTSRLSSSQSHFFRVDEFRRPEFEVTTRADSSEPHLFTGHVTTAATANYYAGGPLPDAPVTWQVTSRSTTYTPPNWSDFTFGIWQPWWSGGIYDDGGGYYEDVDYDVAYEEGYSPVEPPGFGGSSDVERFAGRTDASGTHYLRLDFSGAAPDQPLLVSANAAVEDVNRQQFASTVDLLVHSGERYVGLGGAQTFVREGEPLKVEAIVTDIDGNAIAGEDLVVTAARLEYQWVTGEGWQQVEVDPRECSITSAVEAVECEFATDTGGQYQISSTITDANGGQNRTELTRWVSGGDAIPSRTVDQEQLELVPSAETYAPGDTAELLVLAPFERGSGIVTVARNGIESAETFAFADNSAVIQIPITEASIPGVTVQVDLVGSAPRTQDDGTEDPDLPPRPAFATGRIELEVPPASRTLTVTPTPRSTALEPGGDTSVDLTVTDASGRPVEGAQAAVVVVDEAVLALTGYTLRDPLALFYGDWYSELRAEYGRRGVVLARPDTLGSNGAATTTTLFQDVGRSLGGDGDDSAVADSAEEAGDFAPASPSVAAGGTNAASTPITERTNFDALAVFAPTVTTDANGRATVDVPLPDNLTRYRVMVVAVAGDDHFGAGESSITARLPLSVRPSAPRFLNFGDVFELPIVVQNQTDQAQQVEVVVEATNLDVDGNPDTDPSNAGRLVTVPANDRIEVRFPAEADEAGTARFRATVVSGDAADSATIELPVYTPATTEAFATYGVVDSGSVAQPTLTPSNVVPQFGGLEIATSATILQALTDAVLYIVDYEYESADALASRVLSISALRDVFAAFNVDGVPSTAELNGVVKADLERLAGLQNSDGGWSYWRRYMDSVPYNTIHVTHALVAAKGAGYAVPNGMFEQAMEYLRTVESRYPSEYSEHARHVLSAYALHVRDLAGERDPVKALDLYDNDDLALDAVVWLWPVLDDQASIAEIERMLANVVVETPSAATFSTSVTDDVHLLLNSDRRTDGIVLDAMIRVRPDDDLVPKIVQGLIGNQRQGRWNNIQENAFILLALKRYFDTYESATPDFAANVWVGDTYAAAHEYRGYTIDSQRSTVPMEELVDPLRNSDPDIVIAKDGTGRLYYRLGLDYAPADLSLPARDEGFVVERTYEAVTDPDDVTRDADGTWRIKAGAEVRVRLSMVADSRRVNMALVDHLPAGLEIVNTALATSPATLPDEGDDIEPYFADAWSGDWWYPWWHWRWFDHQNLRDDRAEAFSAWLPAGVYDWSYVARATTPGTFVTPPAKAEEIYAPEVFGRTATDIVVIEG